MTPELIAPLLAAPLDVRLALLDADPKGAGWFVGEYGASVYANPTCYCHLDSFKWLLKEGRAAWLPCNPLAIAEHAQEQRGLDCGLEYDRTPTGRMFRLVIDRGDGRDMDIHVGAGPDAHTAAVRLLAEVVGHD